MVVAEVLWMVGDEEVIHVEPSLLCFDEMFPCFGAWLVDGAARDNGAVGVWIDAAAAAAA